MRDLNATTRGVVAALMAVLLGLPAAVLAADGPAAHGDGAVGYGDGAVEAGEDSGTANDSSTGAISLSVARGAWLGRAVRVRGSAPRLAGRRVAIESRRAARGPWTAVRTVAVDRDGKFGLQWRPDAAGRHHLRALEARGSTAQASTNETAVRRVTVYRPAMATWYGPGFYGNRTACGQRLTTRTVGVAHRTLPCGTRVAVRYGRRTAVVPVIDRGPYAAGISYDLTSAAARRLGVTETSRIGAARLPR